jgi:hypothetical protein
MTQQPSDANRMNCWWQSDQLQNGRVQWSPVSNPIQQCFRQSSPIHSSYTTKPLLEPLSVWLWPLSTTSSLINQIAIEKGKYLIEAKRFAINLIFIVNDSYLAGRKTCQIHSLSWLSVMIHCPKPIIAMIYRYQLSGQYSITGTIIMIIPIYQKSTLPATCWERSDVGIWIIEVRGSATIVIRSHLYVFDITRPQA